MKKRFLLITVVILIISLLISCSPAATQPAPAATQPSSSEGATKPSDASSPDKKITIVDWGYTADIQTELFGKFMAEPFMAAHPEVEVKLLGGISGDAITQIKAAQGKSPIDTMLLGKARYIEAYKDGWLEPIAESEAPNLKEVFPNLIAECQPGAVPWSIEIIGIAYNPDVVSKPETWDDLWKPEYKGKIGIVSPSSNAGFLFLEMIAKTYGTDETDMEAIWTKLEELKPFVVANNPETLSQLLENKEIGIAINWNNEVATIINKGFNIKFTFPKPGGISQVGCYAVIKGTEYPDIAKQYVNTALGLDFQQRMSEAPFYFVPVNMNVKLTEDASMFLPSPDQYSTLITIDFDKALPLRQELTDEFLKRYGQ